MTPPSDPFDFGSSGSPSSGSASSGGPQPPRFGGPTDRPAPGGVLAVAGPPVGVLVAAGALAVAGIAVGILAGGSGPLSIAAWVCAGPLAIGVLAAYTLLDTKKRAFPVYTQPAWASAAYWTVLAFAAAGIVIGALRVADWVGRR